MEMSWLRGQCGRSSYMQPYKAIIFDWGGVCCREGEPFASTALQTILKMNPAEIAAALRDVYFDYYRGKYTGEQFWRNVMTHFGLAESADINPAALGAAYIASYSIYPQVFDFIKKLQAQYQIGLLSNLTPEMRDHIRVAHNTAEFFQVEVYSCDPDVAQIKPEAKPYLVALQKLGVEPFEAFFIDNSAKNVSGAEALGIKNLLFHDQNKLFRDMKSFL